MPVTARFAYSYLVFSTIPMYLFLFSFTHKRGVFHMSANPKIETQTNAITPTAPVVREYNVRGYKYIVTATAKAGASEDAAAIVRRLIRKEIAKNAVK